MILTYPFETYIWNCHKESLLEGDDSMSLWLMTIPPMSQTKWRIFHSRSRSKVSHMSFSSSVSDYMAFSPHFPIHSGHCSLLPSPTLILPPPTPFIPTWIYPKRSFSFPNNQMWCSVWSSNCKNERYKREEQLGPRLPVLWPLFSACLLLAPSLPCAP